jgi:hypothetical protein
MTVRWILGLALAAVFPLAIGAESPAVTSAESPTSFLGKIFGKPENFTELNRNRRRNVAEIATLENEIQALEQEQTQLDRETERSQGELSFLSERIAEINREIGRRKAGEAGPRVKLDRTKPPESPAEYFGSMDRDGLNEEKRRAEQRQQELSGKTTRVTTIRAELRKKRNELAEKRTANAELEERIAASLNLESNRYIYRSVISGVFAIIVFYLMFKFFEIIAADAEVKRSIFSGEAGIQFITLFSIVIAVILFGILEILGSNELSALLGGLSGYILGRHQHRPTT